MRMHLSPLRMTVTYSNNDFEQSFERVRVAGSNEYSEVDYLNLSISFSKYRQYAFVNYYQ